jgi:hypothetical protein
MCGTRVPGAGCGRGVGAELRAPGWPRDARALTTRERCSQFDESSAGEGWAAGTAASRDPVWIGRKTAPDSRRRGLLGLAERNRVALGIGNRGNPLAPGHVLCLAQDHDLFLTQASEHGIEVLDVDVHLKPRAAATLQSVTIGSPLFVRDREFTDAVSGEPDVSGLSIRR